MIKARSISRRGAQVGEALANGHSYDSAGKIFYLTRVTVKKQAEWLYMDLGISGMPSPRRRAVAMMIAGGLFKPTDEKIPFEPYVPTMAADESALIQIRESSHSSHYNVDYIQPCRSTAGQEGITLSPVRLAYLSYAMWGVSVKRISELHPWCKDPDGAYRHAKQNLLKTYSLLDAVNGSQAIAHAHLWGALPIDPRVLDPTILEPPQPFAFENSVTIPFERYAHRFPSAQT